MALEFKRNSNTSLTLAKACKMIKNEGHSINVHSCLNVWRLKHGFINIPHGSYLSLCSFLRGPALLISRNDLFPVSQTIKVDLMFAMPWGE